MWSLNRFSIFINILPYNLNLWLNITEHIEDGCGEWEGDTEDIGEDMSWEGVEGKQPLLQ